MIKGLLLYNPKSGEQSIPAKLDYVIERFESHNIRLTLYRLFQNESTAEDILEIFMQNPMRSSFFWRDGSLTHANLMLKHVSAASGVFPRNLQ